VITIQSGMLIALGFLAAALLGLLSAPAFWRRAVRLTTRRIKDTMPLSELEIAADRDRIRAEYAIKMHKLETLVEQVRLAGARQQIEINRRDARVNMLEADLERLQASYEEAQNARRVLEQTIADRLPRVERRLTEAKQVLHAREHEVGELTRTAEKQVQALAAASALNTEQKAEIERLNEIVASRGLRVDGGDAAEEAEIQALRTKLREQAQLLARLQSLSGRGTGGIRGVESEPGAADSETERQFAALRSKIEDQQAEIARLKAAITVFEKNADGEMLGSIRESRLALKARVQSLEALSVQQTEIVAKLRSELAGANERLARQAAHFNGELKRLGPSNGNAEARGRGAASPRPSLAERVAQAGLDLEGAREEVAEVGPKVEGPEPNPAEVPVPLATKNGIVDKPVASAPAQSESKSSSTRPPGNRPRLLDRLAGLSRTS
jgi:chromosome segregation ATPase